MENELVELWERTSGSVLDSVEYFDGKCWVTLWERYDPPPSVAFMGGE